MALASLQSQPASAEVTPVLRRGSLALAVTLLLLIACGSYLRLANLADNPGWDGDEGYNWSIATHLAAGQVQMYALRYAFVQHPPLFFLLAVVPIKLWTHDLIALRIVSAFCGVLTVAALWGLGNVVGGRRLAVAAATVYAIWPQAVLQSRWAYTYNLLALLVVLALWAAIAAGSGRSGTGQSPGVAARYGRSLLAGLLTGLALATDQEAAPLVVALIMLLGRQGLRQLGAGLAAAAMPPALYLGWMLAIRPKDLLFDLGHTATRLGGGGALDQLNVWFDRLTHLVRFDPLIGVGLLGLLLQPRGPIRQALLAAAALLLVVVLKVRDPSPFFRAAEPLLPLAGLGLGLLVVWLLELLARSASRRGLRGSMRLAMPRLVPLAVLLLAPVAGTMLQRDLVGVTGQFATGLRQTLPHSASEARRMAAWVNAQVRSDDLVIMMPAASWLLRCRTADLLQAVAISGHGTAFYPDGLAAARFRYDPRLSASRFLVVDDFTRAWIADSAMWRERALVQTAQRAWQMVYNRGEYVVYANPAMQQPRP